MSSYLPLVSVVIPAYNAEAFIAQTLNSVLSQTYRNIEVLVVDDGSKDRTAEIVESVAQSDYRVILLKQSNAGVAAARNLAIQKSSGEYIAPIDADDIWHPQKLEKQVQCMLQAEPFVGLVYAWSAYIDEEDLLIGTYNFNERIYKPEGEVYTALVFSNFIGNASAPLIRRACLDQVGGYNCELKEQGGQGCEDWDIYLRIAEYYQFRVVPEFLIGYRQSSGSMGNNCASMAKSYHLVMTDVQQRHPEIPTTIYHWSSSHFYSYLLGKSYAGGDHWMSLVYLYKALQVDGALLLRPGLYRTLVTCLLKIAAKPVTSSIWQDHYSWVQFKQRFRLNQQSNQRRMTIVDIDKLIDKKTKRFIWKPYDIVLLKRWFRVMQLCQQASSHEVRLEKSW